MSPGIFKFMCPSSRLLTGSPQEFILLVPYKQAILQIVINGYLQGRLTGFFGMISKAAASFISLGRSHVPCF